MHSNLNANFIYEMFSNKCSALRLMHLNENKCLTLLMKIF